MNFHKQFMRSSPGYALGTTNKSQGEMCEDRHGSYCQPVLRTSGREYLKITKSYLDQGY